MSERASGQANDLIPYAPIFTHGEGEQPQSVFLGLEAGVLALPQSQPILTLDLILQIDFLLPLLFNSNIGG